MAKGKPPCAQHTKRQTNKQRLKALAARTSPLTAARASAVSALGCVAALVRAAALSLASGSLCQRRVAFAARCTSVIHGAGIVFVGASALLDPTLALLAADRGSSRRRLGAQLRRRDRPRGGALACRHLAMPAAACARCAMHQVSLMAPELRPSVPIPLLNPSLALHAAHCSSSQRRIGARLRRCARPRGGDIARHRLAMPAAAFTHGAMLRSSVLVLCSTRPDSRSACR